MCVPPQKQSKGRKKRPEEAILFLPKLSGIDPGLCRNRLKKMCNSPVTDISMNSLTHYLKKLSHCQCAWKECDTITYSCHFYMQLMWLFPRPWPSSTGNTCFIKYPLHQDVWLPHWAFLCDLSLQIERQALFLKRDTLKDKALTGFVVQTVTFVQRWHYYLCATLS